MESLAEVGRVSVKVHQGAIEGQVDVFLERYQCIASYTAEVTGAYCNNPTALRTRARAG